MRTGLSVDALRKRIRRGSLQTVKGNDGLVRVRLTVADMDSLRLADGQPAPSLAEESGQPIKVLEAAAAALHERAARAEAERNAAKAEAAAERERADKAEARAGQAEAEREAARAEATRAQVAAASAEGEAKGLRLALEEARRPFWRRWLG
ncbi:hypothetical protein ACFQS7_27335 [Dankookia sp. GCM10030260]|uniref:hypothetical protein n=1 Tax=Dankookia sp. GCM10030260 TaxID=3273390 RepID=UPI0036218533